MTPKYVCNVCGNRDQRKFLHEPRAGDVVCLGADETGCGNVVEEHKMHEGAQYRKFEGEDDKSHHGPAPNRLYSAAHNMRTSMVPTGGAGGAAASRLRQAYDAVELGLSNLGSDEKRTRVGYKDQMKKRAFDQIVHVASNLELHASVVSRAQALFANFRDEKEYVQRYDAVLAACVVQAAEEAAEDEHRKSLLAPAAKAEAPRPLVASSRARLLAKPLGSAATLGDGATKPARVCVDKLGLTEDVASELLARVVRPLAARLYPDLGGASLDHHVAFFDGRGAIVKRQNSMDIPGSREPTGLDTYAYRLEDEAEVTLDICLRSRATEARVRSRYLHGSDAVPVEPPTEVSHHAVGAALLYRGDERHSRVVGGPEELHLVLWCRSSQHRDLYAYTGDEDIRLYGPLAHEYNEPGVPGPGDHDGSLTRKPFDFKGYPEPPPPPIAPGTHALDASVLKFSEEDDGDWRVTY